MRKVQQLLVGLLVVGATACADRLTVENENNADRERALARPTDVEALIAGSYKAIHDNVYGSNTNIRPGMLNMGLESYALLGNFGMVVRGGIPRVPIDNSRGNQVAIENYTPYLGLYRAARQAAVGLGAVEATGFSFFPASNAQTLRIRSFANFVVGVALGYVALAYDSGAVVTPLDPAGDPTPLPNVGHSDLTAAAIGYLNRADSLAGLSATGGNGFPLPATWINGNALTAAQFRALVRGYKALFRANDARTPADNAGINWTQVIADANDFVAAFPNGFDIQMTTGSGAWSVAWPIQHDLFGNWHQAWQFMVGMADSSGGYDAWLATPVANRQPFLVRTADQRFPSGDTRGTQITASGFGTSSDPMPAAGATRWYDGRPYFRNRTSGEDVLGDPLASSYYDNYRFRRYRHPAGFNGTATYPIITAASMRLLAAEGYLRAGNVAAALPLIDASRTTQGGLPQLQGVITATGQPVPGGAACVPRIPVGPTFTSTACGDVWEALKWEMRMETAFTTWGGWYFDGRRWGDLPEGTAVHFPVPYQELDTRRQTIYSLGGVGGTDATVGKGTYGL